MSRILILYGTTDGQTRKIAMALCRTLQEQAVYVDVVNARYAPRLSHPEQYDAAIVAASIQMGNYQRPVRRWVKTHAKALNRMPSAFVSVCLGIMDRRPEAQEEVRTIMRRFLQRSRWDPTVTKPVAGALPYTRYGWLKKWIMKRIVAKAGGDTDTTRDFEYTDWEDLRAFARDFALRVPVGQPGVNPSSPEIARPFTTDPLPWRYRETGRGHAGGDSQGTVQGSRRAPAAAVQGPGTPGQYPPRHHP